MQRVGKRKPNNGYRHTFNVMQEDLVFVDPGVDAHVQRGARPKHWLTALTLCETAIEIYCPANIQNNG